jgi:hypothetical protein
VEISKHALDVAFRHHVDPLHNERHKLDLIRALPAEKQIPLLKELLNSFDGHGTHLAAHENIANYIVCAGALIIEIKTAIKDAEFVLQHKDSGDEIKKIVVPARSTREKFQFRLMRKILNAALSGAVVSTKEQVALQEYIKKAGKLSQKIELMFQLSPYTTGAILIDYASANKKTIYSNKTFLRLRKAHKIAT